MTRLTVTEVEQRLRDTFAATENVAARWRDGDAGQTVDRVVPTAVRTRGYGFPVAPARVRRFAAPAIAAAAVLAVALLAVGLTVVRSSDDGSSVAGHHSAAVGRSSSVGAQGSSPATASESAVRGGVPAWVTRCIPSRDKPAPGYVGHAAADLGALARQRGEKPIVVAADGKCVPHTAIGAPIGGPKMVAVATETTPSGVEKIVYAAYVDPNTGE